MKRKRTPWPRGTYRTPAPTSALRVRRSTPIRGRRRRQNGSLDMSCKTEKELSVHQSQPEDGQNRDHRDGDVGGDGDHGQVRRGGGGADRVCVEEPVKTSFHTTSTKVKPKDWTLVRK